MSGILFENALLLDPAAGAIVGERAVLVRDGRIAAIAGGPADGPVEAGDARRIDVGGRVLMPGLCDAHVHVTAATPDFAELGSWSPSYVAVRAAEIMEEMLLRGFTTVRDAGGADFGLARAVEEGRIAGPRLLFAGKAISQTGGHGDMRGPGQNTLDQCYCCAGLGRVCDGVSEVRRACRDEIRKGATQIKLMVAGGVSSPTDRVDSTQFSEEEITAAVRGGGGGERLRHGARLHRPRDQPGARVAACAPSSTATCWTSRASRCSSSAARSSCRRSSTYHAIAEEGVAAGFPGRARSRRSTTCSTPASRALDAAHRAGVKTVLRHRPARLDAPRGSSSEFAIRGEVMSAGRRGALRDDDRRGAVRAWSARSAPSSPGARADLHRASTAIRSWISRVLQDPGAPALRMVMKDGVVHREALGTADRSPARVRRLDSDSSASGCASRELAGDAIHFALRMPASAADSARCARRPRAASCAPAGARRGARC